MTYEEIQKLVEKYENEDLGSTISWYGSSTQYDDLSARVNYSMIREFKPKKVLEFGSRTGRCTHDILKALMKNGGKYVFKSYEIDKDLRAWAQENVNKELGEGLIKIGGDVTKAEDIPDGLDYVFIDNSHDTKTTEWVFEVLLKKCRPGAIVHFHDLYIKDDMTFVFEGDVSEMEVMEKLIKKGNFPLERLFFYYEVSKENTGPITSAWFTYKPLK